VLEKDEDTRKCHAGQGEQTGDIGIYIYTSALARGFTNELQPGI
jgi:hypothetical protein